jgi:uncharacterized protein
MKEDFHAAIERIIRDAAKPVDKFGHQPRLYALTREIGKDLDYDDDIVYAAAWLHDLGVFIGNRPEEITALQHWDHVNYACSRTPELLADTNFPPEKIPAVLAAMRAHQPHDDPQTIEATILRDADILEQLGAIGILRSVAKVGRDTRYASFSDVLPVLRKSLTELPPKLRLEPARRLAKTRIDLLDSFIKSVEREAGELLY